jgi:hypothetical protein
MPLDCVLDFETQLMAHNIEERSERLASRSRKWVLMKYSTPTAVGCVTFRVFPSMLCAGVQVVLNHTLTDVPIRALCI